VAECRKYWDYWTKHLSLRRQQRAVNSSQQCQHDVWGAGQLVTTRCFSRRSTRHTILGCDELTMWRVDWHPLSKIGNKLVQPLTRIYQKIIENKMVPSDWKDANVIPMYNSGIKSTATNYRPINLTSQLCKVFETTVRDQVVKCLQNNWLIRDLQHTVCVKKHPRHF